MVLFIHFILRSLNIKIIILLVLSFVVEIEMSHLKSF